MARTYTVYKRKGKRIYYAMFRDENGTRSAAISTGQTSKAAAERWCIDFLKKGGSLPTQGRLTFEQYAEDWWVLGKCPYIRAKEARGFHLSPGYARIRKSYLDNYVLPEFRKTKLMQITPRQIESWIMGLYGQGKLSPATCNRILGTLKVMLNEAVRLQLIPMNPASPIGDLKEHPKERGVLPMPFVKRLFDPQNVEKFWSDPKHYTVNLLAASAGLRLGECQGLMIQNVGTGFVRVLHSYDDRHGLQQPKWNSTREVPLPKITDESLHRLIELSPYQEPEDLVFWSRDGQHALSKTTILAGLRRALEKAGMRLEEQKAANVVFHSWRHLYNTSLRSRVGEASLRRATGHKNIAMTDNYDHYGHEHLNDVKKVVSKLFDS